MRTEYLYGAVFLLLGISAFFFLHLDTEIKNNVQQMAEKKRKIRSLKRVGRFKRLLGKMQQKRKKLLAESGIPSGIYGAFSLLCAFACFAIGKVIYSSLFIATAVGMIGVMAPLLVLGFRQTKAGTIRTQRLCDSMTMLSNSYIATEDFIQAVQENLDNLSFDAPFRSFLTYVTYMDGNIKHALRRMESEVNNPYFSQWVDALIMAQDDRALKYVCASVVDSMHDVISAQQESDAAMYAVWRDYLLTLVLIFSVPLVFKLLMAEAYVTMTTSPVGQSLFLLLLLSVLYSVLRALKINTPIMR